MRYANVFKVPELRSRLLFTLGLLSVYRLGVFVTTPGVDRNVMRQIMQEQSGTFLGMFNLFSGGALEQLSIFALGIMPYVTASIIVSLMSILLPQIAELRKEGEAGQRKLNQWTRYGTVVLSCLQSYGIALYLEKLNMSSQYGDVVADPGWGFRLMTTITLTTGTAFIMWLGEQITERGIGNGISLIIFAGIVADLPDNLFQTVSQVKIGQVRPVDLLVITAIALGVIAMIVFFERAQRQLPIHYAKRMVGGKMVNQKSSHLPLRVNMAGVIPPIFAQSLLMFPNTLASFGVPGMEQLQQMLVPGHWMYAVTFATLCIFFAFFYTAVQFQPADVADNLKKQNAFIPGIRPGKATAEYIDNVVTRITVAGASYLAFVCTLPTALQSSYAVPFALGGTSIMIVVGVALDTVQQIDAYLITRHYEGLTGPSAGRLRSRRATA
jgi:preprotein translocase subunit SecY